MKKYIFILFFFLLLAPAVLAQDSQDQGNGQVDKLDTNFFTFKTFLCYSGYCSSPGIANAGDPQSAVIITVSRIIAATMGFLGVVFLILITYAGFMWMTAGGNEEQVTKARKLLINGVIGLGIIMAAYAITYFAIFWASMNLYQTESAGAPMF